MYLYHRLNGLKKWVYSFSLGLRRYEERRRYPNLEVRKPGAHGFERGRSSPMHAIIGRVGLE